MPPDQPDARPFSGTPAFYALGTALVVGAALTGYLLGGPGTGEATASTQATAELQASLPTSVYRDCAPVPVQPGQTASLTCASVVPGADELRVTRWTDAATMDRSFDASASGHLPADRCSTFTGGDDARGTGRRSTWGGTSAVLACSVDDAPDAVLLWQYRDAATQVVAVRRDADSTALFAWWQQTTRTPLT